MLLEAYFVQMEGNLNKLSTMREYVDDTEDYINIMLDEKQNQLLQMGVMLRTATLIISAGIVVVGMFVVNIHIELFGEEVNPIKFWETAAGTVAACLHSRSMGQKARAPGLTAPEFCLWTWCAAADM